MDAAKTLCFSGLDSAEEARLKGLFEEANRRSGGHWALAPEAGADVLVIDVDSIYGHMTWLKYHNSPRTIIALTAREEPDSTLSLRRPVEAATLQRLLQQLESGEVPQPVAKAAAKQKPEPPARQTPAAASDRASPAAESERPVRQEPTRPTPPPRPSAAAITAETPAVAATPKAPARDNGQNEAPRARALIEYLQGNALPGPVRLRLKDAPDLVLDPQTQTYVGGAALKPLAPYARQSLRSDALHAVTPSELGRLREEHGPPQPFVRLLWLCALLGGDGQLAGFSADQKFKLPRWPQIEREFPKHFRIATVMMKQPATAAEIAAASGASEAEVADLLNAYVATGFAEPETMTAGAAIEVARSSLLDRLRGRRGGG